MAKQFTMKTEGSASGRTTLSCSPNKPTSFFTVITKKTGQVLYKKEFPFQQMQQAYIAFTRGVNGKQFSDEQ